MAGEIQALFDKYQKWYPYYTRDAIVDLMVKNGAITSETAKKIKSGMSLFLIDNSVAKVNDDYSEKLPNMDSFEPQNKTQKKDNTKLYHSKFDFLEVDNSGNVIPEQFSLETIKKRYSNKKYKIITSEDGFKVVNTQNDQKVFESDIFDFDGKKTCAIHQYDDTGRIVHAGQMQGNKILWWDKYNKKEEVIYGERYASKENSSHGTEEKSILTTDTFGNQTVTTYDRKTNKILEQNVSYNDGSSKSVHYENGIIQREWYNDKDYNVTKTVEYYRGKPFVEMDKDYKPSRYFLVEDLASKINSRNMLGQKSTPKSLINDIKTRIDKGNAFQLWDDYYGQTGNDLFDDIDKTTLSNKEKEDLKQYLAKSLANMTQIPLAENIAKVLQNDIKGIGSGNLKYHLQAFFNNKNELHLNRVSEILGEYYKLTGNDLSDDIISEYGLGEERYNLALKVDKTFCKKTNWDISEDIVCKYLADKISKDISGPGSGNLIQHIMMLNKNNVIGVLKHYTRPQILGVDVTKVLNFFKIDRDDYEDWATMEPLICAVYNEKGLDNNTKEKLVNHVIKCIGSCHSSKYTCLNIEAQYSDIAHDLITNKNDSNKVKIDAKRLDNRIESSYDNIMQLEEPSYPNGKVDEGFSQNTTGDCWLLAGIISVLRKPQGKKMLDNLLTVDNEKRQVTVDLKGVNKKYVISFDEIAASNHLVLGDGDIRAIEIAIDKYLKQEAYSGKEQFTDYNIVDINGNWCKTVFNILIGNANEAKLEDITKEDINSPDSAYTISFNRTKVESHIYPKAAYDEKGKPMDIIRQHAYGVIKADDKYVWLLNPWNPSLKKPIRITWEKLQELDITIEYTQFNKTKKA